MKLKLTDRYELRTFDSMNLQLWELRDVEVFDKPKQQGGKATGEHERKWVPCGNYFPDVPSAVRFVFAKLQREDPYEGDLEGAVERIAEIAEDIKAHVAATEVR